MTPAETRDYFETRRPNIPSRLAGGGPVNPPLSDSDVLAMLDEAKQVGDELWHWRYEWAYFLGAGWWRPIDATA